MAGNPNKIDLRDGEGRTHTLTLEQLEDLLGPTIVAWENRNGVIVPIWREFADELLNTSEQSSLGLLESKPAAFLNRRAYVSSPNNAPCMQPGSPILFYESSRSGGRGAIVAVARIVDSLIQPKDTVPTESRRRLVVDALDPFSKSKDVLVSTFDSILKFPKPFTRHSLQSIGAVGRKNLQMATSISCENLRFVLDAGWSVAG